MRTFDLAVLLQSAQIVTSTVIWTTKVHRLATAVDQHPVSGDQRTMTRLGKV